MSGGGHRIIEGQGGIEKTAATTFYLIALAATAAEGKELATVKNEMLQRFSWSSCVQAFGRFSGECRSRGRLRAEQ